MNQFDYVVVGAGLFGAVCAERIARELGNNVLVIEKRDRVGGNSYSYWDKETGIEIHKYGSHIFHTSDEEVWNYVNRFGRFNNYRHTVFANYRGSIFSLPINMMTVNQFFKEDYTPEEAKKLIREESIKAGITNPRSFEEKAISMIGKSLYEAFIKGYTYKQWSRNPSELSHEIFSRMPVRFNYDNNYYNDKYQGIPVDGYEKLIKNILTNKKIEIVTNTDFKVIQREIGKNVKVIYSGPIDEFLNYKFGPLEWRSLRFEFETKEVRDYQGTAVINYVDKLIPYTRIHEFKHYHPEKITGNKTVICREFPVDYRIGKERYYPINDDKNQSKYEEYFTMAKKSYPNYTFGGRLGGYKYLDMDKTIQEALNLAL